MDIVGAKSRPEMVKRMTALRKKLGKTQHQVAHACRITQATISRMEQDPNVRVTDTVAVKILAWIRMGGALRKKKRLTARAA